LEEENIEVISRESNPATTVAELVEYLNNNFLSKTQALIAGFSR
jgi:hypothetical protein